MLHVTTSVLQTYTRDGIGDHDLQVIRDFALEAPYEWRLALEQLCELAVQSDTLKKETDKARESDKITREVHEELQTAVKGATKKMLQFVEKLEAGRRDSNLSKGDIDTITEGVRAAFEQLVEAAE